MGGTLQRLKRALLATGIALAASVAQAQDITVGVILATTGPGSAVGIPTRNAVALWPDEIGGHKLKLLIQDDRSDPSVATSIGRRLATEDKVDVIVGGSLTPSALALAAVATETEVPFFTVAPTILTEANAPWSFNVMPLTDLMASALFAHMDKANARSVGYIGFSDVWGDQWLAELRKYSQQSGVKITAEERFGRADTSVSGQVLRLISSRPDVILVGGTSGAAGLVQKALVENGFKGTIYHTHGATTRDFIRIAGRHGDGAIAPAGPSIVAEELPADNVSKPAGVAFTKAYEGQHGASTRTPFAAHAYDAGLVLQHVIPIALQKAQPGTKEFRVALKRAIEGVREFPVAQGVLNFSTTNHNGMDERARVLITVKEGSWRYLQP